MFVYIYIYNYIYISHIALYIYNMSGLPCECTWMDFKHPTVVAFTLGFSWVPVRQWAPQLDHPNRNWLVTIAIRHHIYQPRFFHQLPTSYQPVTNQLLTIILVNHPGYWISCAGGLTNQDLLTSYWDLPSKGQNRCISILILWCSREWG